LIPFRLLAEGSDDKNLIMHVAREHRIEFDPREIRDCQGIHNLLHEVLPEALKGTATVAVVVDADLDFDARWNEVQYQLRHARYDAPATPPRDGLIMTNRRPAVGVWLMPDNTIPGALEDFAKDLIPSNDSLWARAVSVVAEIPVAERRFKAERKAEVHTYLAWQEEPGTPFGCCCREEVLSNRLRAVQTIRALAATVEGNQLA
jgi:hypothetical protein